MSKKKAMKKKLADAPVAPAFDVFNRVENDKIACIKILNGPFKDVIFHYDVVTIGEENQDGSVNMNFSYQIVEGENIVVSNDSENFEEVAASILLKVVTDMIDENPK